MCGGSRGAAFVRRTCPKMENEAAAFLSGSIMWAQLVCVQRGAALAATVFVTRGLEATIGVRYALACAHVFTGYTRAPRKCGAVGRVWARMWGARICHFHFSRTAVGTQREIQVQTRVAQNACQNVKRFIWVYRNIAFN